MTRERDHENLARRVFRPRSAVLLILGLALGSLGAVLAHTEETDEPSASREPPPFEPGTVGHFSLVSHTGEDVTEASYPGEFLLVVFGYTHCPDVCPLDLARATMAINQLGESGEHVQPLFITVDPKRDTVEHLAQYITAFHPRMVGLTGSREQIAATAKAYDADYIVAAFNGEYLVQHSSGTYLVAPEGRRILLRFSYGMSPEDMSKEIRSAMQAD